MVIEAQIAPAAPPPAGLLIAGVVLVVAIVGWLALRREFAKRGVILPSAIRTISSSIKLMAKQDTDPVLRSTSWFTWKMAYGLCVVAIAIGIATSNILLVLIGFIILVARLRRVFSARQNIIRQMFGVASGTCRYPANSMVPSNWVTVQQWLTATFPGKTIIVYPPAFKSEDPRVTAAFERAFVASVSEDNSWKFQWEPARNRVTCTPIPKLPKMAKHPGPGKHDWDKFPLGVQEDGSEALWDVSTFPHLLIAGPTGSGKSVMQRAILLHALVHPDWRVIGIDPKRVELSWLKGRDGVLRIATLLEDSVDVLESVKEQMTERFDRMSQDGANHFKSLHPAPPAILVMVDETFNLLAVEGIKTEEGKERDQMKGRATALLGEIGRLGRAAGIHLVLATQRPDAKVIPGELRNNCDARIACGRMDTTPSLMVLDSEAATRLPAIKGRSMLRCGQNLIEMQGYFSEISDIDRFSAPSEESEDLEDRDMDFANDATSVALVHSTLGAKLVRIASVVAMNMTDQLVAIGANLWFSKIKPRLPVKQPSAPVAPSPLVPSSFESRETEAMADLSATTPPSQDPSSRNQMFTEYMSNETSQADSTPPSDIHDDSIGEFDGFDDSTAPSQHDFDEFLGLFR